MPYPKRLIEVDLPIKQISAHARREKSIRHGHISTLHIWWARRPLAACRAVICAALWPDPADENCPQAFRDAAAVILCAFAEKVRTDNQLGGELCASHFDRWRRTTSGSMKGSNPNCWPDMRYALLDFIADFANWDASTVPAFLETARALTQAAHEALGGAPGTRPLVVDPFAGGGSIPLEALRVGADAFASDLNPVAVLLNKVVLEYIPTYGQQLADEVRKWGQWIKEQAEKELAEFYPKDPDGATPIAYLWARTITCEGPGCGAEVPLMRSLWLAKKGDRSVALRLLPDKQAKQVDFEIIERKNGGWFRQNGRKEKVSSPTFDGTVRRSSVTCPVCGYTTPADKAREQFVPRDGGADDARLIAVVLSREGGGGVTFRTGTIRDVAAFTRAVDSLATKVVTTHDDELVPTEPLPYLRSIFNVKLLGIDEWGKLFNRRQALALVTLVDKTRDAIRSIGDSSDHSLAESVGTCLAFAVDRCADYWSSLAVWAGEFVAHTFGRQALGIIWDYAEVSGFSGGSGSYAGAIEWICRCIEREAQATYPVGQVHQLNACEHSLPDDSAQAFVTDPPYYDAVPYADLSDFFYVWLKRSIGAYHESLFPSQLSPKEGEIVQLSERNPKYAYKTQQYFEDLMKAAMAEGRRVLDPDGIGLVVFAHKSTAGWETQIKAMIDAGWVVTGSWPIDTERPGRLRANNAAALASSVHLICRPRENPDGSQQTDTIGDWRDVLAELPGRIHDWMPRLAAEGVVGADAIFACLGPALEIFSRYARVEKASGEQVTLKEYLEYVWAAVSKEALAMIFEGADASGFEEDARLTAMWLWTLAAGVAEQGAGSSEQGAGSSEQGDEDGDDEDEGPGKKALSGGYVLEYDAARKISQGLGAHLERLSNLIEVKGDKARLLPVAERARYLFGKDESQTPTRRREQVKQLSLLEAIGESEETASGSALGTQHSELTLGKTTLDQVHQSMLLFAAGRGDGLKNYLLTTGVGRDQRFWRLAQALSALYPASSDEKRWVDGVLARKKGLGL